MECYVEFLDWQQLMGVVSLRWFIVSFPAGGLRWKSCNFTWCQYLSGLGLRKVICIKETDKKYCMLEVLFWEPNRRLLYPQHNNPEMWDKSAAFNVFHPNRGPFPRAVWKWQEVHLHFVKRSNLVFKVQVLTHINIKNRDMLQLYS